MICCESDVLASDDDQSVYMRMTIRLNRSENSDSKPPFRATTPVLGHLPGRGYT